MGQMFVAMLQIATYRVAAFLSVTLFFENQCAELFFTYSILKLTRRQKKIPKVDLVLLVLSVGL